MLLEGRYNHHSYSVDKSWCSQREQVQSHCPDKETEVTWLTWDQIPEMPKTKPFCKGPDSKYSRLCRLHSVSVTVHLKFTTVTWKQPWITCKQTDDCLNKTLSKQETGWIWSTGHGLLTPYLKNQRIKRVGPGRRDSNSTITKVF